jgi:hypothetical protein
MQIYVHVLDVPGKLITRTAIDTDSNQYARLLLLAGVKEIYSAADYLPAMSFEASIERGLTPEQAVDFLMESRRKLLLQCAKPEDIKGDLPIVTLSFGR